MIVFVVGFDFKCLKLNGLMSEGKKKMEDCSLLLNGDRKFLNHNKYCLDM